MFCIRGTRLMRWAEGGGDAVGEIREGEVKNLP
jgi:hypothetical protein